MTLDNDPHTDYENKLTTMTTIPSFLNAPDADIILHTSDDYDLRVYRRILSTSSPFFDTLFSLPQPADTPEVPSVDIPEPSSVVIPLLQLIYPVSDPHIDSLDVLAPVLAAAIKYNVKVASKKLRRMLVDRQKGFICSFPRRVYAIACRYHLREEMRVAANATLALEDVFLTGVPIHHRTSKSKSSSSSTKTSLPAVSLHEDLKWIAAWEYCRLVHLRRERVVGVLRLVLEDLDDEVKSGTVIDPSSLGIMLPQAVLQEIVADNTANNDTNDNRDHDQVESEALGTDEDQGANIADDTDTDMDDDDDESVLEGSGDDSDTHSRTSGSSGNAPQAQGSGSATTEVPPPPVEVAPRKPAKCSLCNNMHYTGSSPPRWYTTWQRLAAIELAKRPTVEPALDLFGDTWASSSCEARYGYGSSGRGQRRAKRLNRGSPSPSRPSPSSSASTSRQNSPSPTSQSFELSTPTIQSPSSTTTQAPSRKRTRGRTATTATTTSVLSALSEHELETLNSLSKGVFGMPFLARCVKESGCGACAGSLMSSWKFLDGLKKRVEDVRDGDEIF